MTDAPTWTDAELNEFNNLTYQLSSRDQATRSAGRFTMNRFVERHGRPKCDAMWAHLLSQEKK